MFGADFFDGIWGTVHRHDYCEPLADRLVIEHGRCRILDVGTGCGWLVRCLRDRGCDAWGLDVSEYAVANSHGHVRLGDIRDIPYASDRFDVVHSSGVWGYFPEADIDRAWAECNRVGRVQAHNIDYEPSPPEHRYLYHHPPQWWKDRFYPKVLVACPNHEVKEYAFGRWIDNVRRLTWPNYDVLVVDNSPNDSGFADRYRDQVPILHIDTAGIEDLMVLRLNLSYEAIRLAFLAGPYARLLIIESDVIPPTDIVERLLDWGRDSDWIAKGYPTRGGPPVDAEQGIGCALFSRRLMEGFSFADLADNYSSDHGLWIHVKARGLPTVELWDHWPVAHLER